MHVLVIGGTGFLGPHVVRHLVRGNHDVTVVHRGETPADLPEDVTAIHTDRNDLTAASSTLRDADPDVVVDVIPYTGAQAGEVVQVFDGVAERVVAVSSGDVYRNYDGWRGRSDHEPDPPPLAEDAPVRQSRYPYRGVEGVDFAYADDYDKLDVEEAVMEGGPEGVVVRLPALYGPGDAQHRFRPHVRRIMHDQPAILLGRGEAQWKWTHGYVENCGAAVACAATHEQAAGSIYNAGETATPTQIDRIIELGATMEWGGAVVSLPDEKLPDHLRTPFDYRYPMALDTSRLRTELDFDAPVSRKRALRRTLEWQRETLPDEPSDEQLKQYASEYRAIRAG